jgi:hypothetical protein
MAPNFTMGSWIVIGRLKCIRALVWGCYYYIIDLNLKGILRRILPSIKENCIQLVCDQPDQENYPPIDIHWDQIKTIFKVMAGIKRLAI